MRGWFGIGIEGVSKAANVGALFRTAHAFGASFVFTIDADYSRGEGFRTDTSDTPGQIPLHEYADVAAMALPTGCQLVGVELLDEAVDLPSFRHPTNAAYVLGRERGSLSPELVARCAHVVRIPTRYCVNLAVAGAIVMYDRTLSFGRFGERPLMPGGGSAPGHVFGQPRFRSDARQKLRRDGGDGSEV